MIDYRQDEPVLVFLPFCTLVCHPTHKKNKAGRNANFVFLDKRLVLDEH